MTRRKVDDGGVPADGGTLPSSGYTSTNAVSPDGSLRLRAVLPRSGTTPISAASDRKRSVIPDLVDPVTAGDEFLQHPHNLLSRLREESPAWSAGARRWFAWRVRANLALICAPVGRKTPASADTKDGERKSGDASPRISIPSPLAGSAQLRRELGAEQVGLSFQVELAAAVHDDLLERAALRGLLDGGHVDALLAVVGGQGVSEGGLARGVRSLHGQHGALPHHRLCSSRARKAGAAV